MTIIHIVLKTFQLKFDIVVKKKKSFQSSRNIKISLLNSCKLFINDKYTGVILNFVTNSIDSFE